MGRQFFAARHQSVSQGPLGSEKRRAPLFTLFLFLPALQKNFVNIFFVFAWEFWIEKWRGFLVKFFWSPSPTKQSTKNPRKIRENSEQNSGQNSGRKFEKFGKLSFCNFSDLSFCGWKGNRHFRHSRQNRQQREKTPLSKTTVFTTQRALRDILMSRGKNCLPTVSRQFLTRNYPRPNCPLKCLPNCLSPHKRGLFILNQN